jgi:polysaccharide biosynthesis protein PelC
MQECESMSHIRRSSAHGKQLYIISALLFCMLTLSGCAIFTGNADTFTDPNMDFGSIHTVAVLPFANMSRDAATAERVRDVFMTTLLATGAMYVAPVGEVNRGITRTGLAAPMYPSNEEVVKLCSFIKADAAITGTLREYGEVRSGSAIGNIISLSLQLKEAQTGRIIWSASTTRGGVSITDRLFGGGGEPMNPITEKAVNDLINKLLP